MDRIELLHAAKQHEETSGQLDAGTGKIFDFSDDGIDSVITCINAGMDDDEINAACEAVSGDIELYFATIELCLEDADEDETFGMEEYVEEAVEAADAYEPDSDAETPERTESAEGFESMDPTEDFEKTSTLLSKKNVLLAGGITLSTLLVGAVVWLAYDMTAIEAPVVAQQRVVKSLSPVADTSTPPVESVNSASLDEPMITGFPKQSMEPAEPAPVQAVEAPTEPMPVYQSANSDPTPVVTVPASSRSQASAPSFVDTLPQPAHAVSEDEIAMKVSEIVTSDMTNKVKSEVAAVISTEVAQLKSALLDRVEKVEGQLKAERQKEDPSKYTRTLDRLGNFHIMSSTKDNQFVVALSPSNKVITLTPGEKIYVANSALVVKEIVADGQAVIFSKGWFIDDIRMQPSEREVNLAEVAREKAKKSATEVAVTKKQPATSPSVNKPRFETIAQAPMGWELNGVIPPNRAIVTNPDQQTFTVGVNDTLPGLGEVRNVSSDRIYVGRYVINLSFN